MSPRIRDIPPEFRPREKLAALGADALSAAELIAILLRTGLRGRSAIEIANDLLAAHDHSIARLAAAPPADLARVPGIGRDKALTLNAAFALALRAVAETRTATVVRTAADAARAVAPLAWNLRQEKFWVLLLDNKRRLLRSPVEITAGTLTSSLVHPREVFSLAVRESAAAAVAAHNHPTGDPSPSREDLNVTRRLVDAGKILGIPLLDHVIVGGSPLDDPPPCHSFAEHRPELFAP